MRVIVCVLAMVAAAGLGTGCERAQSAAPATQASAPTTRPATAPVAASPRNDIPGLGNFAKVSDVLYRGEQPTAEGFRQLKAMGVKTVISLRAFHSDRELLQGTGLGYVRISCKAWHPEDEDTIIFLKVMEDKSNWPVFVHCQHGADRTGTVVALYRVLEQGWTIEQAVKELDNFGFHPIWTQISEYLGKFEAERMRKLVKDAPAVKVEVVP